MTKNNPNRITDDQENKEVVIKRIIDSQVELVFKAWADPEQLSKWWGPHKFTNPVCELDYRPGGAIRINMQSPDGTIYPMTGIFQEIVEPELLVFTSVAFDDKDSFLFEVHNIINFSRHGDQTALTLRASVSKVTAKAVPYLSGMTEGWNQSLERLKELLVKT